MVKVLIGQDKVLTGWIEATPIRYDAKSINVGISGRSKTADLIDCTANTTLFTRKTLHQIASELAKPFGIKVINQKVPKTLLQAFQADYGETVHEVLNKALGSQQAFAWDDEIALLSVIGPLRRSFRVKIFLPAILSRVSANVFQNIRLRVKDRVMMTISGKRH